jgi:hypothetical protein
MLDPMTAREFCNGKAVKGPEWNNFAMKRLWPMVLTYFWNRIRRRLTVCFLILEIIPKGSRIRAGSQQAKRCPIFFLGLPRIEQMFQQGDTRFASAVAQKLWRDRRCASRESDGLVGLGSRG